MSRSIPTLEEVVEAIAKVSSPDFETWKAIQATFGEAAAKRYLDSTVSSGGTDVSSHDSRRAYEWSSSDHGPSASNPVTDHEMSSHGGSLGRSSLRDVNCPFPDQGSPVPFVGMSDMETYPTMYDGGQQWYPQALPVPASSDEGETHFSPSSFITLPAGARDGCSQQQEQWSAHKSLSTEEAFKCPVNSAALQAGHGDHHLHSNPNKASYDGDSGTSSHQLSEDASGSLDPPVGSRKVDLHGRNVLMSIYTKVRLEGFVDTAKLYKFQGESIATDLDGVAALARLHAKCIVWWASSHLHVSSAESGKRPKSVQKSRARLRYSGSLLYDWYKEILQKTRELQLDKQKWSQRTIREIMTTNTKEALSLADLIKWTSLKDSRSRPPYETNGFARWIVRYDPERVDADGQDMAMNGSPSSECLSIQLALPLFRLLRSSNHNRLTEHLTDTQMAHT